jgi:hypothetical protein
LGKHCEMNSVDTFEKRLREAIAAVEKEIQSHNQQVESLTKRLEGLKRADELFESDQAAIAELLQASIGNGSGITRGTTTAPAPTRAIGRSQREPTRRADPGRHDGRGSQAPSAPKHP